MPKPQNDDKIATNSRADNGAKGEVGCDLDSDHKKTTKKSDDHNEKHGLSTPGYA